MPPPLLSKLRAAGARAFALQPLRAWLLTLALLAACALFVQQVDEFYPLRHWLFWRYLRYWAYCGALSCACTIAGLRLVAALGCSALSASEYLLLSFASGVLLFGLGVFVAGICGLFGPVFFFAWPVLLCALGGRAPWRTLARSARRLRSDQPDGERSIWPRTTFELARAALVGLGLVAIYLQILTPENVSFDARWYHLGIAQQYAVRGGIERFPEGWYLGAYPQLATWLYTWAFLQPGSLFDRVSLASHLEFVLFLATVPAIGLLVKHLVKPARVRWVGCVLFLFPSIYLYDTNLNTGADHVLAFWAVPMALAVIALIRAPSLRTMLLASLPAAGAILTRYQAIYLLVPAGLVVLYALATTRKLSLIGPGVAAVLLLTAPHWLKNAIYYGDPLYPVLHKYFPAHPFHRGAVDAMLGAYYPGNFIPQGTFAYQLPELLTTLVSFSFVPHNWENFEIPQPTFGSLFTLLGVALPFITRARRILLLLAACYLGVAIWYLTNHQARFLQALLPWMAACVVALCQRVWQIGAAPRLALSALVGLQLLWGTSFYFAPNHVMVHESLLASLAKHLYAGLKGQYAARFRHYNGWEKVNRKLPHDAVLLVHKGDFRLGLERRAITDQYGYQGALSYSELGSPRAVWQAWRDLGVTHVYWARSEDKGADVDEKARERVFRAAIKRVTRDRIRVSDSFLAELSPEPPPP